MPASRSLVVLDTNILISGLITRAGNCARIIDMVFRHELEMICNDKIMDEYSEVTSRSKLQRFFDIEAAKEILSLLSKLKIFFEPVASTIDLRDEDDRIFYDTAKQSSAILITGNLRHFPPEDFIMSAHDFLEYCHA
jgi:putative PIN family toxin of toxin-antitoxin system